jgi:phosphohistidine phosphatase SixA
MLKRLSLALVLVALTASAAAAQTTYFIVRHAERADGPGGGMGGAADPSLSAAGRARAAALAAMLKDVKLTAVFATEFKRTQQTAAPTAKAQGQMITTVPADQTATLVQKLKAATGAVLVVGHSNTVPEVIAGLGVTTPVTVGDTEFDNLFIVTAGQQATMVRLHYK